MASNHIQIYIGTLLRRLEGLDYAPWSSETMHFEAVRTVADFRCLDEGEVLIGYMDGVQGLSFARTSMNQSYWHGWRNGAVDGGFIAADEAQVELQEEFNALAEA